MSTSIVLFELNEVPWRVVMDHVHRRPHGAMARLLTRADAFVTHAEDRRLSPWVTWSTLHRGVDEREHGITNLNADLREVDRARPPLWRLIRAAGLPTGVFGSMHTHPLPADPRAVAFHVPDPFADDSATAPAWVEPFQRFNLSMSRRSARNVARSLPWRDALSLAGALPKLGIRAATLASVAAQLAAERRTPARAVRRRGFQAILGFDVFMRLLDRTAPRFATFFTNHVAATMHRFWAAAYPDDYDRNDYPAPWRASYGGEITWAMDAVDGMLQRLLAYTHARPGRQLWLTTSMGQAATRADNRVSTQLYLEHVDRLMTALGYRREQWQQQPAMAPRVVVAIDERGAAEFPLRAGAITVAGEPLVIEPLGGGRFCLAVPVVQGQHPDHGTIDGRAHSLAQLGFADVAIEDESGQTAYHVPEGVLAVHHAAAAHRRVGALAQPERGLSTRAVAPMVLEGLGVPVPDYMRPTTRRAPMHSGLERVQPRSRPPSIAIRPHVDAPAPALDAVLLRRH